MSATVGTTQPGLFEPYEPAGRSPSSALPPTGFVGPDTPLSLEQARALFAKEMKRLALLDAVAAVNIMQAVRLIELAAATSGKAWMLPPGEQAEQIERVRERIARYIRVFFVLQIASGKHEFHAEDLQSYVAKMARCAPASADRVMRAMKQDGDLDYLLIDRRKSLYRAVSVREEATCQP